MTGTRSLGSLELVTEKLSHITLGEAKEHLPFPHSRIWRNSAVHGRRTSLFISTEGSGPEWVIKLHQDGVSGAAAFPSRGQFASHSALQHQCGGEPDCINGAAGDAVLATIAT